MSARPLLLGLVVAIAGAAAGYQFARRSPEIVNEAPGPAVSNARLPAAASMPRAQSGASTVDSLAAAIARPTDFTQTVATYVLAAESDEAGLRRLIEEADAMSHQSDRSAVLSILFSRYGDIDPRAALAYLDETRLMPNTNLLFTIFHSWSKVDLDGAILGVHERTDPRERLIASDAIIRAYDENGSEVLADIRSRLPSGSDAPQTLNEILRLAGVDPEAAVSRALQASGLPTEQVLAEVASRWARQDPEAAFAHSARIQDATLRDRYLRGVFYRWAEQDPERVIEILNQGLSRADETAIVNSAIRVMAAIDPHSAFERVQTIRDGAVRSTAHRVLMRVWVEGDPASAAFAVEGLEDPSLRQQLGAIVAESMAQGSPDAALNWAESLDGGYGPTWRATLQTVAETNPQLAVNRAVAMESETDRYQSLVSVFTGLVRASPETAAAYWLQISDENAQSLIAGQIAGEWARLDADAAERWVLALPAGATRENGLDRLIAGGSYAVLDTARLINSVENEDRRAGMLSRRLFELVRSDGLAAAEGLLNQVVLSAERRRELAQSIRDQAARN